MGEINPKSDEIFKITPPFLFLIISCPKYLEHKNDPVKLISISLYHLIKLKFSRLSGVFLIKESFGSLLAALLIRPYIDLYLFEISLHAVLTCFSDVMSTL